MRLLVNLRDRATGRVRFHATRSSMVAAQAAAIGSRLLDVATTWKAMDGRLRALLRELREAGFTGVVLGDIHLADVRAWYEERVREAGLEHVEPLWGEPPQALLGEFVAGGGRALVTCVDTERLDESWLGRVIDEDFVREIGRLDVDACGENGEYHSFAFAGPVFQRPVAWRLGGRRSDGRFVQLDVLPADPRRPPSSHLSNTRSG